MAVATTRTVTLLGATGHLVDVQADLSQGLIRTAVVGRPDASINEARDRVRAAIENSGLRWPMSKRVTILLSPADLPKSGPHFDLAMAVAMVAATGRLPSSRNDEGVLQLSQQVLDTVCFIGELTLDGRLRSCPGVLAMTLAAKRRGITTVFVPEPQIAEAQLVPGVEVYGARSLPQVLALLTGDVIPEAEPVPPLACAPLLSWRGAERDAAPDMADVHGVEDARFAVEVAAAGGHHLMLSGPKGAGKTTLAERIPGLLPDLDLDESLELTAIYSLAGDLVDAGNRLVRPPFRAPHHATSRTALLGGGTGRVRPGEVSKAHLGCLFMDEFPHFPTDVIEALRQPLESGEVTLARGDETATYPARAMFVLAMNPCPCGDYVPGNRENGCTCGEVTRRNYRRRVTGPIQDRIDIWREVEGPGEGGPDPVGRPESSAAIRARVVAARRRTAARLAGTPWRVNADVPGPALKDSFPLVPEAHALLEQAIYRGQLSRRGATRVHRVAWTLADLWAVEQPGVREVETALALRLGQTLSWDAIHRGSGAGATDDLDVLPDDAGAA